MDEVDKIRKNIQIMLKKSMGLEYLNFYSRRGKYYCSYISSPEDFDIDRSLLNSELGMLLQWLSIQQGKVYFEDCQQWCTGLDELKALYLPMKLAVL